MVSKVSSSSVFPRRIYLSLHTGGTLEERIPDPRPDRSELLFLGYMKKIKQLENVKYFKYFSGMITSDGICTSEIISRIVMAKSISNKKTLFTSMLDAN
jgi:hypothetical protein